MFRGGDQTGRDLPMRFGLDAAEMPRSTCRYSISTAMPPLEPTDRNYRIEGVPVRATKLWLC